MCCLWEWNPTHEIRIPIGSRTPEALILFHGSCLHVRIFVFWTLRLETKNITWWFKVTFLGWLSDPFKGLSDLQLGDEKGTLNHLANMFSPGCTWWGTPSSCAGAVRFCCDIDITLVGMETKLIFFFQMENLPIKAQFCESLLGFVDVRCVISNIDVMYGVTLDIQSNTETEVNGVWCMGVFFVKACNPAFSNSVFGCIHIGLCAIFFC